MIKAKVAEIFDSIQGEGLYFGEKQIFVRFFGCNLNCRYCDTKLDYFKEYETEELFNRIKSYQGSYHSISWTGGEPLLHNEFLKELLKLTKVSGFKNYLETNGTLASELESVIENIDIVAMDVKLPGSTGMRDFWEEHSKFLKIASRKEVFIKAVICASTKKEDLLPALEMIKNSGIILVLQPNSSESDGSLAEKLDNFKSICFQKKVSVRIIPQMHKIMGVR